MKISYNWLIQYLDIELSHNSICEILTESGLEVESCQEIKTLDKMLERVVLGEIRYFQTHPYMLNFNILQVDIGKEHMLQIVCGDKNISKGKKVIIALIGSYLLDTTEKKKILEKINNNGIISYGILCSSKNIGLPDRNILFIYNDKICGRPFKELIKIRKDYCIEIEMTQNRSYTMSHWGIARELYSILKARRYAAILHKPSVENLQSLVKINNLLISINDIKKCKRYSGCIISGVKIAPSPIWMKHRLQCIGLLPNNNVIDIINFVMHEFGQPLYAFDIEDIDGKEIHIKNIQENIILNSKDFMICDEKKIIGLAGIFSCSKIQGTTKDIFIEAAYFEAVSIKKNERRHGISTYPSFLFEREVDPEQIVYVLKRAAILIKEIAGGNIQIFTDIYPRFISHFKTILRIKQIHSLLGNEISKQSIKKILYLLEIDILLENKQLLNVSIPIYKIDVYREIDLIEDFLRIYGLNHIKLPKAFYYSSTSNIEKKKYLQSFENDTSTLLNAQGFYEVINLSLTRKEYIKFLESTALSTSTIKLLNPLSKEISLLRESLLFGLLERISYNIRRNSSKLKFFEWGKIYDNIKKKYNEKYYLGLIISGNDLKDHWLYNTGIFSFFYLKGLIEGILNKFGLRNFQQKIKEDVLLESTLLFYHNNDPIARIGRIKNKVIESFDIKQDVFYAEIYCTIVFKIIQNYSICIEPISQLPGVRRDLAILLDKRISFEEIFQQIKSTREEIIKDIQLFDVYQGNNLQRNTKSYALSFYLEDRKKNLTEGVIVKTMENIKKTLSKNLGVDFRK